MNNKDWGRKIIKFLGTAVAVYVASRLVPGIEVDNFLTALIVSLILALLNTFIKPLLQLISLPLIVLTLGIFLIVINAVLLLFTADLVPEFHVSGFWPAFWGAIVISIVSYFLDPPKNRRNNGNNPNHPQNPNGPNQGGGGFTIRIDRN